MFGSSKHGNVFYCSVECREFLERKHDYQFSLFCWVRLLRSQSKGFCQILVWYFWTTNITKMSTKPHITNLVRPRVSSVSSVVIDNTSNYATLSSYRFLPDSLFCNRIGTGVRRYIDWVSGIWRRVGWDTDTSELSVHNVPTKQHGVTSRKTIISVFCAVRTSDLTVWIKTALLNKPLINVGF